MKGIPFSDTASALDSTEPPSTRSFEDGHSDLEADYQLHRRLYERKEDTEDSLKKQAFHQAQTVVLGLSTFLFFVTFLIVFVGSDNIAPAAQAVVFGAPITAIAAITIFSLLGVFGGANKNTPVEQASDAVKIAKSTTDIFQ